MSICSLSTNLNTSYLEFKWWKFVHGNYVNPVIYMLYRSTYSTFVNMHPDINGEWQTIKISTDLRWHFYLATVFVFVEDSIYNLRKGILGNKSICVFQSKMYY